MSGQEALVPLRSLAAMLIFASQSAADETDISVPAYPKTQPEYPFCRLKRPPWDETLSIGHVSWEARTPVLSRVASMPNRGLLSDAEPELRAQDRRQDVWRQKYRQRFEEQDQRWCDLVCDQWFFVLFFLRSRMLISSRRRFAVSIHDRAISFARVFAAGACFEIACRNLYICNVVYFFSFRFFLLAHYYTGGIFFTHSL